MDILHRTALLKGLFSYEKKVLLEDKKLAIIPCRFNEILRENEIADCQKLFSPTGFCSLTDDNIRENKDFTYLVFTPRWHSKSNEVILLMHGLNERTWEKYLVWAEYLTEQTGKPVVLFPIAFHMNRTPDSWFNPRAILPWVNQRKEKTKEAVNSTFFNVALSSRISDNPLRFYASGRESVFNLWQLVREIKSGAHPLFAEGTSVNIFAYSIGAMLSQVFMLANPEHLTDDTKLFMFCGGSIFCDMNGSARDILDAKANEQMKDYYINEFTQNSSSHRILPEIYQNDDFEKAFQSMISPESNQAFRENFFLKVKKQIQAISLKKDIVIPTMGIIRALGKSSGDILQEIDFPFPYTHQIPFPSKTDPKQLSGSFLNVFNRAASFL